MIQKFLWDTYSAHCSLLDNIALSIIGVVFIFGVFLAVRFLDRELTDLL
jgi:hypothetical protein